MEQHREPRNTPAYLGELSIPLTGIQSKGESLEESGNDAEICGVHIE